MIADMILYYIVYVDFGSSDTITLNLLLGGNNNNARERTWNIEILTIPCNSVARGKYP